MTLGLAGYGEAFFDDLRVELVEADEGRGAADDSDIAQAPANRRGRQASNPAPSLPSTATDPSGPGPGGGSVGYGTLTS